MGLRTTALCKDGCHSKFRSQETLFERLPDDQGTRLRRLYLTLGAPRSAGPPRAAWCCCVGNWASHTQNQMPSYSSGKEHKNHAHDTEPALQKWTDLYKLQIKADPILTPTHKKTLEKKMKFSQGYLQQYNFLTERTLYSSCLARISYTHHSDLLLF